MKLLSKSFLLLLIVCSSTLASNKVLNVYNWSGYIPPKVIRLFEHETGIRVNYSTFDSNQTLYAKLKVDANSGYDVVVPTSYYVDRMRREGMLLPLDKSKLPNIKYLNRALLNRSYDPHNQYSLPYLWGTTGIIANIKYCPKNTIHTWKDLWDKKFHNQLSLSNSMRDMFAIGMKVAGYSINDHNPEHIKKAYLQLKALLPNVQTLSSGGSQQMYVNEDSLIGMIESGDANAVIQEDSNFYYIFPKDGIIVWVDSMVIPKGAAHIENAYKFINFVMRPDIAKMISEGVGYSSPNVAAIKLMSKDQRQNRILNPRTEDLRNSEVEGYVGEEANRLYMHYWELLKIGG